MTLRVFCLGAAAAALLCGPTFAQTAESAAPATSAAAATPAAATDSAPVTQAPPASAPTAPAPPVVSSEVHSGPIPPPPPGKGQVVFFRPRGMSGALVWFNVRENGVALGKLTPGVYFVKVADPGSHTFTAATENHNVLHLEVDDGETYYVKGSITMGFFVGEANMSPSDAATFDKAYPKMKVAPPPEPEAEPVKKGG